MKTNPLRSDLRPLPAFLASAALTMILWTVPPAHAASWEGIDDFSSGISPINWTIVSPNTGQMSVAGANGHASFLVPASSTASQSAYIAWPGTPSAAEDWAVEITGHNSAGYSLNGDSQLQLAVYHTTSIGYRIAMVVEKDTGGTLMFNVKHRINGTTHCALKLPGRAESPPCGWSIVLPVESLKRGMTLAASGRVGRS